MDVLVVGAGEMGQWFGTVLVEAERVPPGGGPVELSYYDRRERNAREAAERTGGNSVARASGDENSVARASGDENSVARASGDENSVARASGDENSVARASGEFDVVCVAVPIPAVREAIATHAPAARRALIDLTGTMNEPVEAMAEHAADRERCSFHPLFAPANEPGNVPAVVGRRGEYVEFVEAALRARGNTVFETTVDEHDGAMRTVQARAHAAVLAYALSADPVPGRFQTPVSAELSELAAQVAGGAPRVYADIQGAFDGASDVADVARELADADHEGFERLYLRAAQEWGAASRSESEDEGGGES